MRRTWRRCRQLVAALVAVVLVHGLGSPAAAAALGPMEPKGPGVHQLEGSTLLVRRDVTALSSRERRDFVAAVLALKAAPSPYDPALSYYDQFVAWHLALYPCGMGHDGTRAHGGPMFLPWHRHFLLLFERALHEVSGRHITVPYWDWTDPASTAAVFADDFMGGDGNPEQGFAVTTGPFRKGQWTLNVDPVGAEWQASATTHITRRFGSMPITPTLPKPSDVTFLLGRPVYDVAPFDGGSNPNVSFRNALEGFWRGVGPLRVATGSASMLCGPDGVMMTVSGEGTHNRVHGWVGGLLGVSARGPRVGTMFLPTSPNDPVFFLHHSNVDRLWAEWQETHGIDSYDPRACTQRLLDQGCHGSTTASPMPPPSDATPADLADTTALGYRYDSTGAPGDGVTAADVDVRRGATPALLCELPVA